MNTLRAGRCGSAGPRPAGRTPFIAILAVLAGTMISMAGATEESRIAIAREGVPAMFMDSGALASMTAVPVRVIDESGIDVEYTCAHMAEVLTAAGVGFGKVLRGARLSEYVMVEARDGYRALFSIVEIDPAFREKPVMLCYAKGGAALPDKEGPFRLVVADEARHARWVRQIVAIRIGVVP